MKYFPLLFLFVLLANLGWGQSSYLPQNGLIGYWPLDGNANDAHLFGNNGVMGNTTPSIGRHGHNASGLYFNGTNTYVTIPSAVMAQVTSSFSVSIWVNPDTLLFNREIINDRITSHYNFRFRIGYGYVGHTPTFSPDSAYFDLNSSAGTQKVGAPKPNVEGWTHYVYVFDSTGINTGTIRAYCNGILVGSRTNSNFITGSRPVTLGRALMPAHLQGTWYFSGTLDDVAIWNRALTGSEVSQIYHSCQLLLTSHPVSQVASYGSSPQFQVMTNSPTAQFQWQVNEGNGWLGIDNNAIYTGAQAATLTVLASSLTLSGNKYRCLVVDTNQCFSYSLDALLTVNCQSNVNPLPPSISNQAGMSESISINGAVVGTNFTWQSNTGSGWFNLINGGQFSGVQTSNLSINALNLNNHGQLFRCITTYSSCSDTSNVTELDVYCGNMITASPTDYTAPEGQTAQFIVTSNVGQQYQWYRNDGFNINAIQNSPRVGGANSDTLTIYSLIASDHLTGFFCTVNGFGCSDTSGVAVLRIGNTTNTEELVLRSTKVYPVPADQELIIEIPGQIKPKQARFYDLTGRNVMNMELIEGRNSIGVSHLPAGQYYLRIEEASFKFSIIR
jgi:hypothetical protein